jgi:anti-sigma regulatory factor (Ser/Thr protein kinase)
MTISYKLSSVNKCDLNIILSEIKSKLTQINPSELQLKCELVLEELIANSFAHSLPVAEDFSIEFYLNFEHNELDYMEVGVPHFDFVEALEKGTNNVVNPSLERIGGIGLKIIEQSTHSFNYSYHLDTRTRHYKIIF